MYAMSVGLDFDNDGGWKGPIPEMIGARDVHALPGNKPGEVWVYWTGPGFTAIGTYSPSEPNKFTLVQKFERTGGIGIRAVPGQGMECCYVLENKDGFSIWKVNSHRNFVPFWWRESVRGIAACQTFLWVFRDREIAYLTHEDTTVIGDNMPWGVVRLVSGQNGVPTAMDDSEQDFIKWLCPCDDGELIAVFDATPYTTTWERNADGQLVLGHWKPMENPPDTGTEKIYRQLLKAWPQYMAQKATLQQILDSKE